MLASAQAATIGYWQFEEGPADSAASAILDSSGNDVTGTANNGPLYSTTIAANAPSGTSLSLTLDGLDDTVTIPAASGPLAAAGSFTVEFWMRSSAATVGLDLLVDKSHGFTDSTGWVFQSNLNAGTVLFGIGTGGAGAGNFTSVSSGESLYDNQWHHLAGVYDSTARMIEFFVDGVSQGTARGTYISNDRVIRLGNTRQQSRFFGGSLDELRISDEVLEPGEFLNSVPESSSVLLTVLSLSFLIARRDR